jgi:hypothetical protein
VLLLSPPGCGKSQFCKALGREVDRPVLILDVGSLMGSLVGQSEERTRQALRVIDAMAPCVVMIDEVEKAFSGVNGSGDSGVSSRMFGTFLSWLNDHESDVFVVCTANDVSKLPPEFGRSERFDGIFFLDLPGQEERAAIWNIYLDLFTSNGRCKSLTTPTGQVLRSKPAADCPPCWMCRCWRPLKTWCRWRSPPVNRSNACGHGPVVDVCRRVCRAFTGVTTPWRNPDVV